MRDQAAALLVLLAACGARPDLLTDPTLSGGAGGAASGGAGGGNVGGQGTGGAGNAGGQGTGGAGNAGGQGTGAAGNTGGTGGSVEICPSFDGCTQCMSTHCPSVYCSCYDNPDCFDLFDCWGGCVTEACQQGCLAGYPGGIADVGLLSDCAATECPACGWGQELQPCGKCIYTDCAPVLETCLSAPQCLGLWQCLNECPPVNVVCQQGCYGQYPDGAALLQPVIDCAAAECSVECPNA